MRPPIIRVLWFLIHGNHADGQELLSKVRLTINWVNISYTESSSAAGYHSFRPHFYLYLQLRTLCTVEYRRRHTSLDYITAIFTLLQCLPPKKRLSLTILFCFFFAVLSNSDWLNVLLKANAPVRLTSVFHYVCNHWGSHGCRKSMWFRKLVWFLVQTDLFDAQEERQGKVKGTQ